MVVVPGDLPPEATAIAQPLRFVDVIAELHRIAHLATTGPVEGTEVAEACRRAESLLARLRNQFLDDVVFEGEWGVTTA